MPDQLRVGTKKARPKSVPPSMPRRAPRPVPAQASRASASGAATQTSKVGNARQSTPPPPRAMTSLSSSCPRSRRTRSPYARGAPPPECPPRGPRGWVLVGGAGAPSGHDDRAAGRRGDDRRVEHLGGGLAALRVATADHEHLEDQLARPAADADDLGTDLDDVTGLD